jgi:hypothetical protein
VDAKRKTSATAHETKRRIRNNFMYWIKSLAWSLLTYSGLYLRVGAPGDSIIN